jgi:regulator of sigma E protease
MSETQNQTTKSKHNDSGFSKLLFAVLLAVVVVLIFRNLDKFWNILLVALGFGAVIMIHEFGHFIVAKLSGIKVEAFSIGFPPLLIGIQKTQRGLRLRILPKFFPAQPASAASASDSAEPGDSTPSPQDSAPADDSADGLIYYLGKSAKPADTEYRIGLVPFGGFVKMLGQEDTGSPEATDDPRSFANKPVIVRIAVVAAGVIFNAISAFLIFMIVFLVGMDLSPAVVGGVQVNSPAARAGIVAGDEIVEVNGEKFVSFENIVLAPALSGTDEQISFVVKHADGTTDPLTIVAEKSALAALPLRTLGIERASALTIERGIKDPVEIQQMNDEYGIAPGDVATAVNGTPVDTYWQMQDIISNCLLPEAVISFRRHDLKTGRDRLSDTKIPLFWEAHRNNFRTEYDLCQIFTMVPRMKVMAVVDTPKPKALMQKLKSIFARNNSKAAPAAPAAPALEAGDIITKIGDTDYPTYKELREETIAHEDKPMPITVLRDQDGSQKQLTVTVTPEKGTATDRVMFGIVPELDGAHPVIAKTVDVADGPKALPIPPGAAVTQVAGEPVKNFSDIARIIRANKGKDITLAWKLGADSGAAQLSVPADTDYITALTSPSVVLPFEFLKRPYKASGPAQAISWGTKKTWMFVAQTYVTLQRLITREVSPKALSGPVGIVSMSYRIASQSIPEYIYFLGLISSCIAVMNLLPLPIVDGGVIVLLIIEKIKGSPINPKLQEVISYAGLAFLGAVFIWLTYNDIVNQFLR